MSYGISFWIVPSLSACGAVVATQLGDPTAAAWYISLYTVSHDGDFSGQTRLT
jgi:hypothetical protein